MNISKVLITGASSGIGAACARLFGSKGYHMVLCGRNGEALKEFSDKYNAELFIRDLKEEGAVEELLSSYGDFSLLINCAGVGAFGLIRDQDVEDLTSLIRINEEVLVRLCSGFVKRFKGQIINVGSIGSFFPGPLLGTYYASKAFVLNFSLALREEVKDNGVVVSCICPGPVDTPFHQRAGAYVSPFFKKHMLTDPDFIAGEIFRLSENKRAYVIPGFMNKLAVFGIRLLPLSLRARVSYSLQRKSKKDII